MADQFPGYAKGLRTVDRQKTLKGAILNKFKYTRKASLSPEVQEKKVGKKLLPGFLPSMKGVDGMRVQELVLKMRDEELKRDEVNIINCLFRPCVGRVVNGFLAFNN